MRSDLERASKFAIRSIWVSRSSLKDTLMVLVFIAIPYGNISEPYKLIQRLYARNNVLRRFNKIIDYLVIIVKK